MTFQAIIDAAVSDNRDELHRILHPDQCQNQYIGFLRFFFFPSYPISVDIRQVSSANLTPAAVLARDGNHGAVNLLSQWGASVDQIAYGYALAGRADEVSSYRTTYSASVNLIAYAYAKSGNFAAIECYRRDFHASVHWIAQGLAEGGHVSEVERYHQQYGASVIAIAIGFARGGYEREADICRQPPHNVSVDIIAKAFALGGHVNAVARYHQQYNASVHSIAEGFAEGGHLKKAEEYLEDEGAAPAAVAFGCAKRGDYEAAEHYRQQYGVRPDIIAHRFARGGHWALVERYRSMYQLDVLEIAKAFARSGHWSEVKKYLVEGRDSVDQIAVQFALGGHWAPAIWYCTHRQVSPHLVQAAFIQSGHESLAEHCGVIMGIRGQEVQEAAPQAPRDPATRVPLLLRGPLGDCRPKPPARRARNGQELLEDYVARAASLEMVFDDDRKYPEELICPILQYPPSIPVRVFGYGPFDYKALMSLRENSSGARKHPMLDGITFTVRDIAADFVTYNALRNIMKQLRPSSSATVSRA